MLKVPGNLNLSTHSTFLVHAKPFIIEGYLQNVTEQRRKKGIQCN